MAVRSAGARRRCRETLPSYQNPQPKKTETHGYRALGPNPAPSLTPRRDSPRPKVAAPDRSTSDAGVDHQRAQGALDQNEAPRKRRRPPGDSDKADQTPRTARNLPRSRWARSPRGSPMRRSTCQTGRLGGVRAGPTLHLPPDCPLTLVAYQPRPTLDGYIEPTAVGAGRCSTCPGSWPRRPTSACPWADVQADLARALPRPLSGVLEQPT